MRLEIKNIQRHKWEGIFTLFLVILVRPVTKEVTDKVKTKYTYNVFDCAVSDVLQTCGYNVIVYCHFYIYFFFYLNQLMKF